LRIFEGYLFKDKNREDFQ
jgi:dynein heavy chain, axonemal